ncbi:hypothetical protein BZG36_03594 [Bifiguratus adelaidae]|uniref:Uncharacterized protein n=1 Tax=Bifiguratus adelaidae TaxID=1938954 RepID=A0A261XYF4_9FUNG|nr:hypothetical protein BZG36_03594 [Bifiguratus adelaidae]
MIPAVHPIVLRCVIAVAAGVAAAWTYYNQVKYWEDLTVPVAPLYAYNDDKVQEPDETLWDNFPGQRERRERMRLLRDMRAQAHKKHDTAQPEASEKMPSHAEQVEPERPASGHDDASPAQNPNLIDFSDQYTLPLSNHELDLSVLQTRVHDMSFYELPSSDDSDAEISGHSECPWTGPATRDIEPPSSPTTDASFASLPYMSDLAEDLSAFDTDTNTEKSFAGDEHSTTSARPSMDESMVVVDTDHPSDTSWDVLSDDST